MMRGRVPWSRLIGRQIKFLTVSVFLGFGLSACSDGSEPEEVVQADENAGQESDDSVNAELEGTSAPASDEVAAADAPQAPEDGVGGTEEGMQPEAPAAEPTDDTASVPAEVVSGESSETGAVDAELTADGSSEPDTALASSTPADAAVEESLTQDTVAENVQPEAAPVETTYAASPYSDGKSISSPGAAKFIKSKSENGNSTAWKSSGSGGDASYVVRSGDTLALIATKIYGNPKMFKELAQLNGIGAPYRIYPGDEMKFATSNKKAQAFAQKLKGSKKTVKVQAGDTLSSIAEKVFGSAYAWKTLAAYNKDKISNPNRITKGMVLAYVDFGGATTSATAPKAKKKQVTVKAGKPIEAKTVNKKKAPITNDTPVEAAPVPEAAPEVVPASAPADDDLGE